MVSKIAEFIKSRKSKKIIEVIERRKRKERKYGREDDDVAGIKLYIS